MEFPSAADLLAGEQDGLSGRTLLAARLVESVDPKRLLDVGCKSGWLLHHLANNAHPDVLLGVDRSTGTMIRPRGDERFHVAAGDARRLPVRAEFFDAVTLFDVIEHVPTASEPRVLREIVRVLRPGGLLFLSAPTDWRVGAVLDPARWLIGHRHYSRDRLLALVRDAGLQVVLSDVRGGWADVLALPLLYVTRRMHLPMPAERRFAAWANRQYSVSGRYTHFLVARKPNTAGEGDGR